VKAGNDVIDILTSKDMETTPLKSGCSFVCFTVDVYARGYIKTKTYIVLKQHSCKFRIFKSYSQYLPLLSFLPNRGLVLRPNISNIYVPKEFSTQTFSVNIMYLRERSLFRAGEGVNDF